MVMKLHANNKKQQGFTIVELLIVVVIIAILAAITIVAYNGIQARSKASAAQSTASMVAKKAEIYNTDDTTTGYPATLAALTGAASTATYAIPSSSVVGLAAAPTSSALQNAVTFYKCGTGATTAAPTTAAAVTTQTGVRVDYFDYSAGTIKNVSAGQVSGVIATYNIGCGL